MLDLDTVFTTLYTELAPITSKLGFKPIFPEDTKKGEVPLFKRSDKSVFLAYKGEKGSLRILYNDNKIRLLAGDKDAKSEDDSDYTLVSSYLLVLSEYDLRDVKSLLNEITENLNESFTPKQIAKRQQKIKAQATVSRSDVRSGGVFYDTTTLAMRLAGMYPSIKDEYKVHMEKYGEFLCETFFVSVVNPLVYKTIEENNPSKMKKLFGILNEFYEDGSNEVQDVIVVTMLASCDYKGDMHANVLKYISDSMMEPFIRVHKILKRSRSARMRLENPPKYKPKKKKNRSSSSTLNQ